MRILLLASLLLHGCASSSSSDNEATDELDVSMEAGGSSSEQKVTYADVVPPKDGKAKVELPRTAVTDWQAFFKPPPKASERSQLELKLERWQETGSPADLVQKARAEAALGRHGAAEASLRRALRLDPDHKDAQLELANHYLRQGDITKTFEFLSQLRETIATSDDTPQSFLFKYRYTLALAYIARGDRGKGHKVLSDMIASDRTFAPAYASLAASYLELDKDSVAEFVARRGLDRVKDSVNLLNLMGVIAHRARQHEAAREWFDKALAENPGFAPALVNRAVLATQGLEYGAAEEDLLAALQHDPLNVDALVALGIVQRRQGNVSGARLSFTKAVDVDPTNAYARFNLGVLLADDLKRPNEALRLFHEVLQTQPATAELRELAASYIKDLKTTGQSY